MATKLIRGCSYSEIWVNPKNWKNLRTNKSLEQNWYLQCKYYDPRFKDKYPNGFAYRKKLNRFKTLEERKAIIELFLKEIPKLFEKSHYNPITKEYMTPLFTSKYEEIANMWFGDALEFTIKELKGPTKKTIKDIKCTVNQFNKAGRTSFPDLLIKDMHSGHVRDILDYMDTTNKRYNKHLSYLSIVWNEMVEKRVVFHNPIRDIRKRKTIKKIRKTMSLEEFKKVQKILKAEYYSFYRYMMIFFYSGARSTELLKIKVSDIDIEKQEYKVVIKKGQEYKETMKVILPNAIPYWKEVLSEAKNKNDYLFSKGLVPGSEEIRAYQITKRFKRLVKDKYPEITADFYSLKHLFLDLLDSKIHDDSLNLSSKLASHTSTQVTNSVYLVNKKERERELLKTINIEI
jgi:integrase